MEEEEEAQPQEDEREADLIKQDGAKTNELLETVDSFTNRLTIE